MKISVVIPAHNEEQALPRIIPRILTALGGSRGEAEVLVVDDASTDGTAAAARAAGARVVTHPYNLGNGAAVKTGIRNARGELVLLMDADGQHRPEDIPRLLAETGTYDLVVGARTAGSHAGAHRLAANTVYNALASYVTRFRVEDLTSGFRVVRRKTVMRFLYLFPNTFSYPTTMTLAYLRSGHSLKYVPIEAPRREKGSKSKIRLLADGTRFFLIIMRIATLYSPFRIFLPLSAALFLTGAGYYLYTYFSYQRFTSGTLFLLLTSLNIFLLGLISEQISQLRMERTEEEEGD